MLDPVTARRRLRWVASCAVLAGVAFLQSPGYLVADTKFDLAVSPAAFLRRALHLWDPTASFGQLQDQSYGYLWPTGPFFLAGSLAGLPPWVVQRLWFAVVLCVAFLGAVRVIRVLGVRTDVASIVGGLAYATSPALLTKIGPISSEAWPFAVAPWVLLPLILGSRGGSARRAGLWAGIAVSTAGGINAAATAAVLPLGLVWLLTRGRGRRRWSLLGWWTLFTVIGTLWWLVPLVILGAYSPPFLDFIESADTTTFANNVVDALRGTTHWLPYLEPSWQAGRELVTTGFLVLDGLFLVALGLIGIAHPRQRHRLFLVMSLLVGLLLTTLGHRSGAYGWAAGPAHEALDGVLAPIRNLHKFDPIIRLPLVIGLAWTVDVAVSSRRRVRAELTRSTVSFAPGQALTLVVCLTVFASASPAWAGRLAPTDPVASTPDYWTQAVDWLHSRDRGQEDGVALLLPGSSFGHYLWGSPDDEPMQYLDAGSWAVRSAVPLAPAGNIRMLDAVEERLAQGRPSAGLAAYLRRAGVSYLVVRNDLTPTDDVPDDALVVQALTGSPGIQLVKAFGPAVGGDPVLATDKGRLLVDGGWQRQRRALEVYHVDGAPAPVSADRVPVIVGGPEDVLGATDSGLLTDEPTVLASDLASTKAAVPTGPVILTDGLLDREQTFGRIHDSASAVRTPGDVRRTGNRVQDYAMPGSNGWRTTAELIGARSVSASSSASDATALGGAVQGDLPYAAIDDDPDSAWVSDSTDGAPSWRIDLDRAVNVSDVRITLGSATTNSSADSNALTVRTAAGTSTTVAFDGGTTHTIQVPHGATSWFEVGGVAGQRLALAEVRIAGVAVRRRLVLPSVPTSWGAPDDILLRSLRDHRTGCVEQGRRVSCLADRARPSEEPAGFERVVTLPTARSYTGSLMVRARPGAGLSKLLLSDSVAGVTASSEGVPDARASALAALDGRSGTTWIADVHDARPALEVHWLGRRTISRVTAQTWRTAAARRPAALRVSWKGGSEDVVLGRNGSARLPSPVTTDWLRIEVTDSRAGAWVDGTGETHALPVGISRLRLTGLPSGMLAPSAKVKDWGCGSGPNLTVGGQIVRSRIVASPADLYDMEDVPAKPCGPISLLAGANDVSVAATDAVVPVSLVLSGGRRAVSTVGEEVRADGPVARSLDVEPGQVVADQGENANAGWHATQDGHALQPVVLDGWRQGWLTDGSTSRVTVGFGPDRAYRVALFAGLACLVLLWAMILWPRRRRVVTASDGAPPCVDAAWPRPVVAAVALVAGGLLGGWVGFVALAAGGVIGALLTRRRLPEAAWGMVAILLLIDGVAYDRHPFLASGTWAGDWAWPSYLALGAVGVVAGSLANRRPNLVRGRSTKR